MLEKIKSLSLSYNIGGQCDSHKPDFRSRYHGLVCIETVDNQWRFASVRN